MLKRALSYSKRKAIAAINFPGMAINTYLRKRLAKRILRLKENRSNEYLDRPKVTAIIQFFNRKDNIRSIVQNLITAGVQEIIAIDDGSIDGSYAIWPDVLSRKNDFLLRCNDLYEVRTYDRAIRMSNGDITILLQDDDIPPPDSNWINEAIILFNNFPYLVILGGFQGVALYPAEPIDAPIKYPTRDNATYSYPGLHKYMTVSHPRSVDPKSGLAFQFVEAVNRAPMLIRTNDFLRMGGMPMEYAPIMCDDAAVCLRAWVQGRQVGLYNSRFMRNICSGGMRDFNQKFGTKHASENWRRLYNDYSDEIANGEIRKMVQKACKSSLLQDPEASRKVNSKI